MMRHWNNLARKSRKFEFFFRNRLPGLFEVEKKNLQTAVLATYLFMFK